MTGTTAGGQASTGTTTVVTTPAGTTVGQAIETITLYAGDNTVDQNLPLIRGIPLRLCHPSAHHCFLQTSGFAGLPDLCLPM